MWQTFSFDKPERAPKPLTNLSFTVKVKLRNRPVLGEGGIDWPKASGIPPVVGCLLNTSPGDPKTCIGPHSTKQGKARQRWPREPSGCRAVRFAFGLWTRDSSTALGHGWILRMAAALKLQPVSSALKERNESPPGSTGGQWNPKIRYLSRLSV